LKQPRPVNLVRELRQKQTDAESILWARLRNQRFEGVKFRRQHPIGNYIVDFASLDAKLIIEIDGGQHNESTMIKEDQQRTKWLETKGFDVVRFWNSDVFENINGVMEKIQESLMKGIHPYLNPLPPGRGEEKERK
jgi:very-short-patch-repair endonuclease